MHEGVHDVLLMCMRVCTVHGDVLLMCMTVCTVPGDVHVVLHDDVRDHAKWCTGLRFFTLVRN